MALLYRGHRQQVRHAHTGLGSKSIAEDPDDYAAGAQEYNVVHYESPIMLRGSHKSGETVALPV